MMKRIIGAMFVVLVALALEQLFMATKIRNLETGCRPLAQDMGTTDLNRSDR